MRIAGGIAVVSAVAMALALPAMASECCSIKSMEIDGTGTITRDTCGLAPLSSWDPAENVKAIDNWKVKGSPGPVWVSFVGDSETRYEFWRLVRMIGRDEYTTSDNFARIAFNTSNAKQSAKLRSDQDPVTVEAKYMDYRFCCKDPSHPSTCHIQTGGDNVTKIHAGYRKVDFWVDRYTDFQDLGEATSSFLSKHSNGLCLTWKMIAYPGNNIIPPLLESQLGHTVHPTGMIFNPGLHGLCFRGNARGSEGHSEHVAGIKLMKKLVKMYVADGVKTKFLLHNVLWANEDKLYLAYSKKGDMAKAEAFRGLADGIDNWNADSLKALGKDHPFVPVDLNTISDGLRHLIRPDCVHYLPPMYDLSMAFDLNILFEGLDMCNEL